MLETDVYRGIQFDGTSWHMKLLNKVGGPPLDKETAEKFLEWWNDGGLQFTLDGFCDIVDKAFDEKERANGNK